MNSLSCLAYSSINSSKIPFQSKKVSNKATFKPSFTSNNILSCKSLAEISFKSNEIAKLKHVIIPDIYDNKAIAHGYLVSMVVKSIIPDVKITEIPTEMNGKPCKEYEDWNFIRNKKGEYIDICILTNLFDKLTTINDAKTVVLSRGLMFSFEDFSDFLGIQVDRNNLSEKREAIVDILKKSLDNFEQNTERLEFLDESLTEEFMKTNNLTQETILSTPDNFFKLRNYQFSNAEFSQLNKECLKAKLYKCLQALELAATNKKIFIAAGNSGKDSFNFLNLAKGIENITATDCDSADNSLVTQKESSSLELYPSLNEEGKLGLSFERNTAPISLAPFIESKLGYDSNKYSFLAGKKPEELLISQQDLASLKDKVEKNFKSGALYSNLSALVKENPELSQKIVRTEDFLQLMNKPDMIDYWKRSGFYEMHLQKGEYVLYDPDSKFNNGELYLKLKDGKLVFSNNSGFSIAKTKGTSFAAPKACAKYIKERIDSLSA